MKSCIVLRMMDTDMAPASGSPMVFSPRVFALPIVANIALLASLPLVAASETLVIHSTIGLLIISFAVVAAGARASIMVLSPGLAPPRFNTSASD